LKERGRPGEEGNEGGFLILPVPLPLPFPDGQTSPSLPSLSRYYPLALGGKGSVRKGEWGGRAGKAEREGGRHVSRLLTVREGREKGQGKGERMKKCSGCGMMLLQRAEL
jgi:hypothetical protein